MKFSKTKTILSAEVKKNMITEFAGGWCKEITFNCFTHKVCVCAHLTQKLDKHKKCVQK